MFLTNKENFVADNGDYKGTQINSSNMLWSLSGSLSLIHKILFGIQFQPDGLTFNPFVPFELKGKRSLTNFTYRKAKLDIELEGYGNKIQSITLDGTSLRKAFLRGNIEGSHSIKILLANNKPGGEVNELMNHVSLPVTAPEYHNNTFRWPRVAGAKEYRILLNGKEFRKTNKTGINIKNTSYSSWQVIAIDDSNYESFANEPIIVSPSNGVSNYEIEKSSTASNLPYKGFSGKGFVEISKQKNTNLLIPITIKEDGLYAIDFKYANGNGPTNTENKCALRTLKEGENK